MQRVTAMMAYVVSEGRLCALKPAEWSLLLTRRGALWDRDTTFPDAPRLAPHEIPQPAESLFDNDGPEHPDRDR